MHFLLLCGRAPTLSNAIQRYPSLSQNLEKIAKPGKMHFCWFPGRPQRYPTLSVLIRDPRKIAKPGKKYFLLFCGRAKTWKNCKTWKNAFFAALREGPNAIQRYPTLSVLIPNPGKIAKPGKMHFLLVSGKARRYPTLSVLIRDPRKIAKPGKKYFLLFCGRAKAWKNGKTWKNAFFAALLEGPNAIQRYPSLSALSQTLEKLQNLENAFFTILRDVAKPLKNCKTCNHTFFSGFREGPIQRYPSLSQTLEKLQNWKKSFFAVLREVAKLWKNCKTWKNTFFAALREGPNAINAIRPYLRP